MINQEPNPRGRPLGLISKAILASLCEYPKTARELAGELQCDMMTVWDKCRRLREAGRVEVDERLRTSKVGPLTARYAISPAAALSFDFGAAAAPPDGFFETYDD